MRHRLLKLLGLTDILNTLRIYLKIRLQLFKYELTIYAHKVVAVIVALLLLFLCWGLALFFASLALAHYLNTLLENEYVGFLLTAAAYFLLGIVIILLGRSHTIRRFVKRTISKYLTKEENDI